MPRPDAATPPAWARPPADGRPSIRTVGPQRGRLLASHTETWDRLAPHLIVDVAWVVATSTAGPILLDVGAGDGVSTVAMAEADLATQHVAVEVHRPGIVRLLRSVEERGLTNVRVVEGDVWDLLTTLKPGSIAAVQCCFPDPWPKARHRCRRLVQPAFVSRVADLLVPGGELRLATDWAEYADGMRAAVLAEPRLAPDLSADGWSPRFAGRPVTTYERRGLLAGRPPRDVRARRVGA